MATTNPFPELISAIPHSPERTGTIQVRNSGDRNQTKMLSPALMQPTIITISIAFLVYTFSGGLVYYNEGSIKFGLYCCILGIISSLLYYTKTLFSNAMQVILSWLYTILLFVIMSLYVVHWLKVFSYCAATDNHKFHFILYCTSPMSVVMQAIFMICITFCLVTDFL